MNDNLFKFMGVKVPNRSGFDKSFKNLFTMPVGTLVPLVCDEVIPNTRVHLKALIAASLPPLASDTFMRCKLKAEAFFVPSRQLYLGYEGWLTGDKTYGGQNSAGENYCFPVIQLSNKLVRRYLQPCTSSNQFGLADYLGYKLKPDDFPADDDSGNFKVNPLPFLAYHYIWSNWYRNTLVQKPAFGRPSAGITNTSPKFWPYRVFSHATQTIYTLPYTSATSQNLNLVDGVSLFSLRQRNFGVDYFTSCTPSPQLGGAQSFGGGTLTGSLEVKDPGSHDLNNLKFEGGKLLYANYPEGPYIEVDGTPRVEVSQSPITISSLRAANSLQQFLERQNLSGFRLVDYVKNFYGANLTDGNANRPLFLGASAIDAYTKGVDVTQNNSGSSVNANPFGNAVGGRYGQMSLNGELNLIDDFTAQEPGYIFVMVSLVPKVTYGSGILRQNRRYIAEGGRTDLANAILQNVGNQPVFTQELAASEVFANPSRVFGYQMRYADWMSRDDELHGLLRDGQSLDVFALQRTFSGSASAQQISTEFLEIPRNYLDQVSAVSSQVSEYGCWVDSFIDYKVSMPLQQFSIPSLQDPAYEHGHNIRVRRGGRRLD